jgi:hypothetical protein
MVSKATYYIEIEYSNICYSDDREGKPFLRQTVKLTKLSEHHFVLRRILSLIPYTNDYIENWPIVYALLVLN